MFHYYPKGVCTKEFELEIDNGIITHLKVIGGCEGNIKGLVSLLVGHDAKDAMAKLRGLPCGIKNTSCPDQIALAIGALLEKQQKGDE